VFEETNERLLEQAELESRLVSGPDV